MSTTATLVRHLRSSSQLSFRELARRAQTSAPTLVSYESGQHEPRLSTLQRLAAAAGFELVVEVRPLLTHPDRRNLELHRLIAARLRQDPEGVRRRAFSNIAKLRRAEMEGRETAYLDAWEVLLGGPDDQLVEAMTSTGEWACALRQTSPFAGVLSDQERQAVIQRVHQELHPSPVP